MSMRLSPATTASAAGAPGNCAQPHPSKAKETTCVRQSLEVLSMPVNQKVQSSAGSTLIAE
jgi:hypothetical protein